ncbi:MAG: carboxymuconolactone decarboxylase family protein [Hellea sp.]|jgi:AhpD family alkylhydroperoxidase|nr:carboxymuconolactone decarboxylase family protein [Hellea sp.]
MSINWTEKLQNLKKTTGALASSSPETMKMFGGLAFTVTKDGALSKKNKELMAIAISICIRCEDCIAYHMQNAIKAHASKEEVIESINVAIEMGGGPSTVYGGKAIAAYEELTRGQ